MFIFRGDLRLDVLDDGGGGGSLDLDDFVGLRGPFSGAVVGSVEVKRAQR